MMRFVALFFSFVGFLALALDAVVFQPRFHSLGRAHRAAASIARKLTEEMAEPYYAESRLLWKMRGETGDIALLLFLSGGAVALVGLGLWFFSRRQKGWVTTTSLVLGGLNVALFVYLYWRN